MNRSIFDPEDQQNNGYKMRNLWQAPDFGAPQMSTGQEDPEEDDQTKYLKDIMRISTNRPAMTEYQNQLSTMPKQEDYKPGKMQQFAAALSGIGTGLRDPSRGYETSSNIIQAPYRDAMAQFNNKLGIRKELSGIEEKSIDDQVKAMSEARAMGLNYKKFNYERQKTGAEQNLKRAEFDNTKRKTDAEIQKMQEASYDYKDQEDGSILGIDKSDPTKTTKIPAHTVAAGQLSAAKMNAQSSRISANAAATQAATGVASEKSLAIYRDVMGKAATTRADNATTRLNKPQSAYQQSRAVDLGLSLLYTDPKYKKYIKQGGQGEDPWSLTTDDGSPMYRQLKKDLKKAVDKSLKEGSPFSESGDDNADDDIIDLSHPRRR